MSAHLPRRRGVNLLHLGYGQIMAKNRARSGHPGGPRRSQGSLLDQLEALARDRVKAVDRLAQIDAQIRSALDQRRVSVWTETDLSSSLGMSRQTMANRYYPK